MLEIINSLEDWIVGSVTFSIIVVLTTKYLFTIPWKDDVVVLSQIITIINFKK